MKVYVLYHPNIYKTRRSSAYNFPFPLLYSKQYDHTLFRIKRRGRGGAQYVPSSREGRITGAPRRVRGLYRAPQIAGNGMQAVRVAIDSVPLSRLSDLKGRLSLRGGLLVLARILSERTHSSGDHVFHGRHRAHARVAAREHLDHGRDHVDAAPMWKTRWLRPRPAGSPEASLCARARLRLPQAPASLGQSAAWAALAGPTGLVFHIGTALRAVSRSCSAIGRRARARTSSGCRRRRRRAAGR